MAYSHMEGWWRDGTPDFRDWLRRAAISWRREPVVKRILRPTKLVTARRLGYKAKPGIVMVERRVVRRYPNMTVRDSYHLYSDGMSHWYEVILMDHHHPGLQEK